MPDLNDFYRFKHTTSGSGSGGKYRNGSGGGGGSGPEGCLLWFLGILSLLGIIVAVLS